LDTAVGVKFDCASLVVGIQPVAETSETSTVVQYAGRLGLHFPVILVVVVHNPTDTFQCFYVFISSECKSRSNWACEMKAFTKVEPPAMALTYDTNGKGDSGEALI
jgi:hypothetical protein